MKKYNHLESKPTKGQELFVCAGGNLLAYREGPPSVIQATRSPDFIVHGLCSQVFTFTDKETILYFLLWAIVVRECSTARGDKAIHYWGCLCQTTLDLQSK